MQNEQNEQIDIQEIFPNIQPTQKAPTMYMVNGIGTNVYGKRDYHAETGAYLKTYCLAILFIPVLAFRAYRVLDAQNGGWIFLGREPLSRFARGWNYFLLLGITSLIATGIWSEYTNSPEYRAQQNLAKAQQFQEQNNTAEALYHYILVARSYTSYAQQGQVEIDNHINNLDKSSIKDATKIVTVFVNQNYTQSNKNLLVQTMKVIEKSAQTDALGSYKLYNLTYKIGNKKQDAKLRQSLLESIVKQHPGKVSYASDLAVLYEQQQRWKDCQKILEPHGTKLIKYEGARILGQIYAQQGNLKMSDALLVPYVEKGIKSLKRIESEYERVWQRSRQDAINIMDRTYRYDRTTSEEKMRKIYMDYIQKHLKEDKNVKAKLEEYREAARIVNVAMDLGLVKLYLARTQQNEKEREKQLQKVEALFLSIQSVAGGSDRYQLTLGQVYYWMGKKEQGKKQFAEFLKQNKGQTVKSLELAEIYRELGDSTEAHKLAKEAYNSSTKEEDKMYAAQICALSSLDNEEKISWLKKTNQEDANNSALLNSALGNKALKEGDNANAQKYLQKAITSYQKQHKTSATLNNEALAHYSLFGIEGNPKHINNAARLLDEAVSLSPNDSIIIRNAYIYLLEKSICDVIGSRIDLKLFQSFLSDSILRFFYKNKSSKQQILKQLHNNETFKKAMSYMKKSMVLAPEKIDTYSKAAAFYFLLQDHESMHGLLTQLRSIQKYLPQKNYGGENLTQFISFFQQEANYYNGLATKSKNPTTIAIAGAYHLYYDFVLAQCGTNTNVAQTLKVAQDLYKKFPSTRAHRNLVSSLLLQTHVVLMQNKTYKGQIGKYGKDVGHEYLIATALRNYPQFKQTIVQNAHFKQAIKLIKKNTVSFPESTKVLYWVLLSTSGEQQAKSMLQNLKNSQLRNAFEEVNTILNATSVHALLDSYWFYTAVGQKERAQQILAAYQKRGVPFPK
ncbi:tetratricopeptide repeat protein [Candidatus Uabimicrobium sp. HlEnr_7]|uniref:tetratricopeptide repeat protein n=1 Tax=Candidatus Uabimicrobium helgolandensis TaxID=3095367 RepID=UPI00355790DB